jgi:NAD(P)-dependent dehydrogenase (short-subunit alcohol dehydrogenase family)
MDSISECTALVVGATGAVGAALCRDLVAHGCHVLVADRCANVAAGTRLADTLGPNARFELLDPHDETEWTATLTDGTGRFGGLDAVLLVEPDATAVAMALRTAGPHLARRGGALVGLARRDAAVALSSAGIPVVELPSQELSPSAVDALTAVALRHVRNGLRGTPRQPRPTRERAR